MFYDKNLAKNLGNPVNFNVLPIRDKQGICALTLVDEDVYKQYKDVRFYLCRGYASHTVKVNGKTINTCLHKMVTDTVGKGYTGVVDHINGNTLDNRRVNLRVCSNSENLRNRKLNKNNSTGYKGVWYQKQRYNDKVYTHIRARIMFNGKFINLGHYQTLEEASHAYDNAALLLHGKFAHTNHTKEEIINYDFHFSDKISGELIDSM